MFANEASQAIFIAAASEVTVDFSDDRDCSIEQTNLVI